MNRIKSPLRFFGVLGALGAGGAVRARAAVRAVGGAPGEAGVEAPGCATGIMPADA